MDLQDKKILAEWMGWKATISTTLGMAVKTIDFVIRNKGMILYLEGQEWNPDTNQEQFKEVLEKLTPMQVINLNQKLLNGLTYQQPKGRPFIQYFLAVSNSMPEVIEATLEVIKGEK